MSELQHCLYKQKAGNITIIITTTTIIIIIIIFLYELRPGWPVSDSAFTSSSVVVFILLDDNLRVVRKSVVSHTMTVLELIVSICTKFFF
jgi:hypothetical protein